MKLFNHLVVYIVVLPLAMAWSTRGASVEQKVEELAAQQVMWDERTNSIANTMMQELTVLDKKVKQTAGELNRTKTDLGSEIQDVNRELSAKSERLNTAVTQNGQRAHAIADAFTKITSVLGGQVKNVEEKSKSLEESMRKQIERTETIEGQMDELASLSQDGSPIEVGRLRQSVRRLESDMQRLQEKYEGDLAFLRETMEELQRSMAMYRR